MVPLADLRKTRDNGRVDQAFDRLRITAEGTENTMPYIRILWKRFIPMQHWGRLFK